METYKKRKCQKQLYDTKDHNGQKEHMNLLFPCKLKIFITKMGSRQTEPKIQQLHVLQTVMY